MTRCVRSETGKKTSNCALMAGQNVQIEQFVRVVSTVVWPTFQQNNPTTDVLLNFKYFNFMMLILVLCTIL